MKRDRQLTSGALALFEAAFMAQGVLIRTDILTRTSIGSRLAPLRG